MGANQDTPPTTDLPPGYGSDPTGSPTIRQGPDGQWYELVNGSWQLITGMPTKDTGNTPFPEFKPVGYDSWDPRAQTPANANAGVYTGTLPQSVAAAQALGIDPNTFQTVMALKDAGLITAADASDLLFGKNGLGGSKDPLAGAKFAEQQRAQRVQEAQAAAAAIQQRIQNSQQARLEGAKMAITPDMAASGYFPGLGVSSPAVRAGLVDPMRFQPVAFNPDQGLNLNQDQIASDLARIRGAAGVGG